jgi:LysR family glycine cleavage system transcriptional activator
MRRNLPPFAALKAFELAANHDSFRTAAIEACQTPSAVSHQIRKLENFLQVKLFDRDKGKSSLTQAGQEYLKTVQNLFSELEAAGDRLSRHNDPNTLRINISHTLASCWLLPLLPSYQLLYPDINIKLINSEQPLSLADGSIDIGIRYGVGQWPGLRTQFLMHEELFIVCHPNQVKDLPSSDELHKLADNFALIHYSQSKHEWRNWFKDSGVAQPNITRRIDFDSRQLVLQAVVNGLGLAIGRASYVSDFVNKGLLSIAYPMRKSTNNGYYLVTDMTNQRANKTQNFCNWLLKQSHKSNRLTGTALL